MTYTRWQADWRNLPEQTTAINRGFLNQVETTFVAQDGRITALEGTTTGGVISPTIVDVKGDLIVATANNTVTRQGIGTDGQVLTADSTQTTGIKWATPTGGPGGGVASVTAGNSTITIGGTGTNPTVAVASATLAAKADLTSGKVPTAELGAGTASSTTFLRGDQTWATPAGGGSSITVQDEGTALTQRTAINFVGAGVTATDDSVNSRTTVTIPGGGSGTSITVQDEGTVLTQRTVLNFTGAGVTATDNVTGRTDIIIPGGSGIPASTVTTKGDLIAATGNATVGRLGVGTDGQVLTASSAASTGLSWTAPSSSGGGLNPATTFQVITASAQNVYLMPTGANSRCIITASGGVVAIKDPTVDAPSITYICIEQDSTGGRTWEWSPMTIVWENAYGVTSAPLGGPVPWDLSPGSITLVRLEWMGSRYGWMGTLLTSVPPLTTPLPTTWTNTAASPQTQNLNLTTAYSVRYVTSADVTTAMDAFTKNFSAALRQRISNSGKFYCEICHRNPTDGPLASSFRGFYEQFGGFVVNLDSTHFLMVGNMFRNDEKVVVHEFCHTISALYYGGANPNEPGLTGLISEHPTLATLHTDCTNNAGTGSPAAGDEWFAELESGRRRNDSAQQLNQVGTLTNGGPGGTGGTPQNRVDRFNNFMSTLAGYQF